jgi:hypothetical protein
MSGAWNYQIRVYLTDEQAALVRSSPGEVPIPALADVMVRHRAALKSQFDAFAEYCAEAEANGVADYPLYRWTKATLEDPVKQAKHKAAFAVRVHDQEVYPAAVADPLEADLLPLVQAGVISRVSRQDTNPANNMPVPADYRSQ